MARVLVILAAALAIAGCGGSEQAGIVGVWFDAEDDTTVEFFEDGTIVVDDDGPHITGDYRLLEDGRMSLDLMQDGTESVSVVVSYQLDGDSLVLTAPDGDTANMTRTTR